MLDSAAAPALRERTSVQGVTADKLVETVNSLPCHQFFTTYLSSATKSSLTQVAAKSGNEVVLEDAGSMTDLELEECMGLIEGSSKKDYENSALKWRPTVKKKEMRLPDMKYIMLRDQNPPDNSQNRNVNVGGFISFMITYEDGLEVIYIYEIHLDTCLQGRGLGRSLMQTVEDIGRNVGVSKSMLTVFRSNAKAEQWYRRVGYTTDEYSPSSKRLRNGIVKEPSYLILSKLLR